jgi:LacI family transcriptional regulator/LacI family sucrose operon transcriptional repressor
LSQAGYRIPEDVQISGFDNIKLSWLFTPELTTIIQSIDKMGTLAVQTIIRYGEGLPFQKENVFDVSLVERQTTRRKEQQE